MTSQHRPRHDIDPAGVSLTWSCGSTGSGPGAGLRRLLRRAAGHADARTCLQRHGRGPPERPRNVPYALCRRSSDVRPTAIRTLIAGALVKQRDRFECTGNVGSTSACGALVAGGTRSADTATWYENDQRDLPREGERASRKAASLADNPRAMGMTPSGGHRLRTPLTRRRHPGELCVVKLGGLYQGHRTLRRQPHVPGALTARASTCGGGRLRRVSCTWPGTHTFRVIVLPPRQSAGSSPASCMAFHATVAARAWPWMEKWLRSSPKSPGRSTTREKAPPSWAQVS